MKLKEFINLTKDLPKNTKIGSFGHYGEFEENEITITKLGNFLKTEIVIEINQINFGEEPE